MRTFRLARAAAEAELLRLRLLARRHTNRLILAGIAAVFVLGALAGCHVAGVIALSRSVAPIWAVLIVAGIDLLLALIFGAFAARDRPGVMEREAMQLRRTAQAELIQTVAITAIVSRIFRRRR